MPAREIVAILLFLGGLALTAYMTWTWWDVSDGDWLWAIFVALTFLSLTRAVAESVGGADEHGWMAAIVGIPVTTINHLVPIVLGISLQYEFRWWFILAFMAAAMTAGLLNAMSRAGMNWLAYRHLASEQ